MNVTKLNLSRNEMTGESLPHLVTVLSKFNNLSNLILHHNMLGDQDMVRFIDAVHHHDKLTYLDMSDCQVSN